MRILNWLLILNENKKLLKGIKELIGNRTGFFFAFVFARFLYIFDNYIFLRIIFEKDILQIFEGMLSIIQ